MFEDAAARNRDHHHRRRLSLALERRDGQSQRVAQDDLLERHPGAERQRARAEAADRAGGDLDHPRGLASVVVAADAQLGVHRSFLEAEGLGRLGRALADGRLCRVGQPRRRHVDGLLEERPVERIGLVEQRQGVERAADEETLQRHLRPRHELLHQDLAGARAEGADVGRRQDRRHSAKRRGELRLAVRADDPAARREHERLEHARIRARARPAPPGRRPRRTR